MYRRKRETAELSASSVIDEKENLTGRMYSTTHPARAGICTDNVYNAIDDDDDDTRDVCSTEPVI